MLKVSSVLAASAQEAQVLTGVKPYNEASEYLEPISSKVLLSLGLDRLRLTLLLAAPTHTDQPALCVSAAVTYFAWEALPVDICIVHFLTFF